MSSRLGLAGPLRTELRKLAGQPHVLVLCWLLVLAPLALVAALSVQSGTPSDTLFGRWVHVSGLATPLVVMGFAGQWAFPVLAGLVAGDVFAGEDRNGTWKLLHSRSHGRLPLFAAKALAGLLFPLLGCAVLIASSLGCGLLLVGRDPIVNLSGSLVESPEGVRLVALSVLTQLPPTLALAALALMLSVLTRNSLVSVAGPVVVGLLSQLGALIDQPALVRHLSPAGAFTAWRGLWLDSAALGPIVTGVVSSLVAATLFVAVAGVAFSRRDVVLR